MNLFKPFRATTGFLYSAYIRCRLLLPRQRLRSFSSDHTVRYVIGHTHVINLDREPARWVAVKRELDHLLDARGIPLTSQSTRHAATDARRLSDGKFSTREIDPYYTLADQLFVEPQPSALPEKFELNRQIQMSSAEIAVACSHISVWKRIVEGPHAFALVLEDDVLFERGFAADLDAAWLEMELADRGMPQFDVLYLSYKEVKHGARKEFLSKRVFRPERGLWYFSGYVLSQRGAAKLLTLLPCRGPIDLWINHQFSNLDVRAIRHSKISQRLDLNSTNSYSILPSLAKIGVIDSGGDSLFHGRPKEQPVFAFSTARSGASSLAMALSMLGYRCCSDLDQLPSIELKGLLDGDSNRVFNAYVNVGCLIQYADVLCEKFPDAKFFVVVDSLGARAAETEALMNHLEGIDVVQVHCDSDRKWEIICEHLKCAPPTSAYPKISDIGQRELLNHAHELTPAVTDKASPHDRSPWVVEPRFGWNGIFCSLTKTQNQLGNSRLKFKDYLKVIDIERWILRDDTFPGNLGLFRPKNITLQAGAGVFLSVKKEPLGVRSFSAAAISSRQKFSFGRFEISMQASRVSGVVTGFFLHRNSPRQEIDIEITGDRPDYLLVNVFYNPGDPGAKFDYGYRGTPTRIALGFDASEDFHRFAIEWDPSEIRWFVDDLLVHRRCNWAPTPIPHLPMTLHVNTWPSRSRELAGRFSANALPASTAVRFISTDAIVAHGGDIVDE